MDETAIEAGLTHLAEAAKTYIRQLLEQATIHIDLRHS